MKDYLHKVFFFFEIKKKLRYKFNKNEIFICIIIK